MTFKLFSIKTALHGRMKCEARRFKVGVLCCGYLSQRAGKLNVLTRVNSVNMQKIAFFIPVTNNYDIQIDVREGLNS